MSKLARLLSVFAFLFLVARWPGTIEAGQTNDALVLNLDFTPTFLGLAETEIPADIQGKSLVPLLGGETPVDWRDAIYYRFYEKAYGIPPMLGVRTVRHKLIQYQLDGGTPELFDLHRDPDELKNVYEEKAYLSIRESLAKRLCDLQTQYEDQ